MPVSSSEVLLGELRTDNKLRSFPSVDKDGPLFAVAGEVDGIFFFTDCSAVADPSSCPFIEVSAAYAPSCLL